MRLVCQSEAIITENCSQAGHLIEGIKPNYLLADRAYDTDQIITKATEEGIVPIIPGKENRKIKRKFDKGLYKFRHLFENIFLKINQFRCIQL